MQKQIDSPDTGNNLKDVSLDRRSFLKITAASAAIGLISSDISFPNLTDVRRGVPQWTVTNGVIQKNGEAVFPLGIYYVVHWQQQKNTRLQHLEIINNLGFNMVHTPIDLEDGDVLDFCYQHDINVAVEFNDEPDLLLSKFKDHPAIAFLQTYDDVDARNSEKDFLVTPDQVRDGSARIQALAPNTLTYASGGHPIYAGSYLHSTDLLGMQAYPIPFTPISEVGNVYFSALAGQANAINQPFIANLQCFNWQGKHRYPTPSELRNMTYQALALGAKGISYYTFYDYYNSARGKPATNDLSTRPELMAELATLVEEIKERQDLFLHGLYSAIRTDNHNLFIASWQEENKLTYLLVNAGQTVLPVGLRVPTKNNTCKVVLSPASPRRTYFRDGQLSTQLAGENVMMVEFEI